MKKQILSALVAALAFAACEEPKPIKLRPATKTDQAISLAWADGGTFAGAVCFFLGAGLMIPAWRRAVTAAKETAPVGGAPS